VSDRPLCSLVEQMKEWAQLLEAGETPTESIIAGLREVAADVEGGQAYSREQSLSDPQHAELVEVARDLTAYRDETEVDDDAALSRGDDGCWVQAWIWVSHDELPPLGDVEALASAAKEDDDE
jgi:hypothetical protein